MTIAGQFLILFTLLSALVILRLAWFGEARRPVRATFFNADDSPPAQRPQTLRELLSLEPSAAARLFHENQNPPNCAEARYLIVTQHGVVQTCGLGFETLCNMKILWRAVVEQRVLIPGDMLTANASWTWCSHPPYSYSCYFQYWSRCQAPVRELFMSPTPPPVASWPSGPVPPPDQFVLMTPTPERVLMWDSWYRATGESRKLGNFSGLLPWYAASTILVRPWGMFTQLAEQFLESHGVSGSTPFAVAVVRHGDKGTEQSVIQPAEYIAPLLRFKQCLPSPHVFVVTETEKALASFLQLCVSAGLNCFSFPYKRPGSDIWNNKLHPEKVPLDDVAWSSVAALEISKRGHALVGTLQSAWVKLTAAVMIAHHHRPIPIVSLRPGWDIDHGYTGNDTAYWSFNYKGHFPRCP